MKHFQISPALKNASKMEQIFKSLYKPSGIIQMDCPYVAQAEANTSQPRLAWGWCSDDQHKQWPLSLFSLATIRGFGRLFLLR